MSWPRRLFRSLTRSHETAWGFAVVGALLYVAWLIVGHIHHELWRDEVHPWSLARLSDGFWDIVTGDRVYDGHPPVWYWYLFLWTFITHRIWGLHLAAILAMGTAALLFLRHAPFPRPVKLLLLASYVIGYEYGVLSRNYTLTWLLIVVFCSLLRLLRPRFILLGLVLALLALTSVFGMFIACALLVMLIPIGMPFDRPTRPPSTVIFRAHPRFLLVGAALAVTLAFFIWSTKPPDPNYNSPDWNFDALTFANIKNSLRHLVGTFLPVRAATDPGYWIHFDYFWDRYPSFLLPAGIGLLALFSLALLPGCFEVAGLLIGLALMAAFGMVRWGTEMRHVGNMFLLLVAAAWIHRVRAPRRNHVLSTVVLLLVGCFQLQSFVASARADWKYSFSGGKAMAAWIEKAGLVTLPIVAGPDALVLTVTGYINQPFISAQTEELNVTQVFHSRRRSYTSEALVERAIKEARARRRPILVVSAYPLPSSKDGITLALLHHEASDVVDEEFWLYRVSASAP